MNKKHKTLLNNLYFIITLLCLTNMKFENRILDKNTQKLNEMNRDTIIGNRVFMKQIFYGSNDTLDGYWNNSNDSIYFISKHMLEESCNLNPIFLFSLKQERESQEHYFFFNCAGISKEIYINLINKYGLGSHSGNENDSIYIFKHSCNSFPFPEKSIDIPPPTFIQIGDTIVSFVSPDVKEKLEKLKHLPIAFDERILMFSRKYGIVGYIRFRKDRHCLY